MATSTTKTNKPINPRGNDQSPKGYNRAALYSGKALDFDGVNDYVAIAYDASTRPTSEITLTAIAKMDWSSSTQTRILSCTEAGGYNISVGEGSFIPTGNTGMLLRLSSSGYTAVYISNTTIPDGYNAISSTFDGRYLKLYLNGTLVATTDSGETQSIYYAYNNSLFVGAEASSGATPAGSGYWNGEISNVRIFNTALTAAQVSDLYNNPEKIVPTGVEDTALKLWLPMMEGAGTTAYDGSGNGNHGTISGATYVNGVGAPVAQSAVMNWNKGVNVISDSEDLTQWDTLVLGTGSVSVTANYAEAPNGTQTADRVQASAGIGYGLKSRSATSSVTGDYVVGIWAKSNTGSSQNVAIYGRNNVSNVVVVTTEWTQIVKPSSGTSNFINVGATLSSDANVDVLLWGGQMEQNTTTLGPYIPTLSTAQTSPVLLPQGLTTGRDITGVNLFENVRKQGALNLDGNSWAGVHDNASHDLSTAVTLEFWCKVPQIETFYTPQLIGKRDQYDSNWLRMYKRSNGDMVLEGNGGANLTTSTPDNTWTHFVVTLDGTSAIIYKNGTSAATGSLSWTMVDRAPIGIGGWLYALDSVANANSLTNGQIAQPRIYNRALTAEEVQRNYDAGKNIYTNS